MDFPISAPGTSQNLDPTNTKQSRFQLLMRQAERQERDWTGPQRQHQLE